MMSPVETGGGKRKVMSLWRCPFPNTPVPEDHVGCAKKAPLCVVSTTIPKRAQNSPLPQFAHAGEIIVFRGNGDEVRRLARNRSEPFNEEKGESYWSQSRAAIASDGTIVVADSNFGQKNGQRIMLIQTGFGPSAR